MEENNSTTNDKKPKNVSQSYWIGFGVSVVITVLGSFVGGRYRGQVYHWNVTIPIGLGFLVGAIFSMLVRGKALLSFVVFSVATVLAFVRIVGMGGFAW